MNQLADALTALRLRRLGVALAVAWFAVLQVVLVTHAASPHALSPDHDKAACVFCVGVDRAGPPQASVDPAAPAERLVAAVHDAPAELLASAFVLAAAPRGPPIL